VYYIGLGILSPKLVLFRISQLSNFGIVLTLVCLGSFVGGILISLLWKMDNWKYHPLTKDLSIYGNPWRDVAASVNLEFRRLEKFSSICGGTSIYVTDSWIVKCSTYKVYVVQQTDSHLSVVQSEEFLYNQETRQSAQFLKIKVMTIPPNEQTFFINLNSIEYNDLKDRLSAPIRKAQDLVIHQTLSDRFLEAFKEQINFNGRVEIPNQAVSSYC